MLCKNFIFDRKYSSAFKWATFQKCSTELLLQILKKYEEMEYLFHFIKFKVWPALFYVNSYSFPNSSIDFKFKFLIVGVRLYLHLFPQFTQRLKTGIFECCSRLDIRMFANSWKRWKIEIFKCWSIGSTSKFFQIPKAIENWDDWVLKRNHQMNKSEWKLEVFNWIFNALRPAISIFSSTLMSGLFYHFRGVNSNISKDWMIVVMTNWLKLLAISEKSSRNFFSLKADSMWSITPGCANKTISG